EAHRLPSRAPAPRAARTSCRRNRSPRTDASAEAEIEVAQVAGSVTDCAVPRLRRIRFHDQGAGCMEREPLQAVAVVAHLRPGQGEAERAGDGEDVREFEQEDVLEELGRRE